MAGSLMMTKVLPLAFVVLFATAVSTVEGEKFDKEDIEDMLREGGSMEDAYARSTVEDSVERLMKDQDEQYQRAKQSLHMNDEQAEAFKKQKYLETGRRPMTAEENREEAMRAATRAREDNMQWDDMGYNDLDKENFSETMREKNKKELKEFNNQRAVPLVREEDGSETYGFQAEVSRLMDIIVNSLYSNKEIFLRELISNGSDACDKIRFLSLTDPDQLGEGGNSNLEIMISVDHKKNVLKIRDRGIGMTRADLISSLGTIANSGTASFVNQFQKQGGDSSLIGQFGVGFYSVYLVADYVEVVTKHNDDKQLIWESKADGAFTITEDDFSENEDLGRGTELRVYLRPDQAEEFTNEKILQELVKKYSEFINFPIKLSLPERVAIPEEELTEEEKEELELEAKEDASEEDGEGEDTDFQIKTKYKTVYNFKVVNESKSIWTRPPTEVDVDEYQALYKTVAHSTGTQAANFLAKVHFRAEGDTEFKSILYIPTQPNPEFYDNYNSQAGGALKLYVKRVFITDQFTSLIPGYLSWVIGVVDSDSLPLNVSRETLQAHNSVKVIRKKMIRKILDAIRKMAEDGECFNEGAEKEENEDGTLTCAKTKYDVFWSKYGKSLKMGVIEDIPNRTRIMRLLRFKSNKSEDKLISVQKYVDRMKDGQDYIYFVAGQDIEELMKSPALEVLTTKGYEILFMSDPVDEWVMNAALEFDDKRFQNANVDDLKLADGDQWTQAQEKKLKKHFKKFLKWWKRQLRDYLNFDGIQLSQRLEKTPAIVVSSKYGNSANMERVMALQLQSKSSKVSYSRRILEVNTRHPIVKKMKSLYDMSKEEGADESLIVKAEKMAHFVYETALVDSGFHHDNMKSYTEKIYDLVRVDMDIVGDHDYTEEIDLSNADEEEEEEL